MNYKICVKTLASNILTFSTNEYKVIDGFVVWEDFKTGKIKRFPVPNCEIEEVLE